MEQASVKKNVLTPGKLESTGDGLSIRIRPKVGILADYLDEAKALGLNDSDFGDHVAKRLHEVGIDEAIVRIDETV